MKLFTLELDVCPATNSCSQYLELLNSVCEDYSLKIVGFIPFGPAGGNPCITFQGKKENLKQMYIEWYCLDEDAHEDVEKDFEEMVEA
jgi:hypothetical protein